MERQEGACANAELLDRFAPALTPGPEYVTCEWGPGGGGGGAFPARPAARAALTSSRNRSPWRVCVPELGRPAPWAPASLTAEAERGGARAPHGPGQRPSRLPAPAPTYSLYSSSVIFRQKVPRTLLSSCARTRPVLSTSKSARALVTVLMFLKICV